MTNNGVYSVIANKGIKASSCEHVQFVEEKSGPALKSDVKTRCLVLAIKTPTGLLCFDNDTAAENETSLKSLSKVKGDKG